ncbi:MAG: LysR family transcriptional regulator [Bacteroidota bacterium]
MVGYQLEGRHFRYFYVLAQELHFRKAAEILFMSQPGLSKKIRELEEIVGVRLFERDNRNVRLTPAGQYFWEESQKWRQGLERCIEQTKAIGKGLAGEIRIGFLGSAMHHVIPALLDEAAARFPGLRFSLEEMAIQQQISALQRNEIDLGFVRLAGAPEGLKVREVYREKFVLVLPADHPLEEENFTSLSELKHAPFVLFSPDEYSNHYYETLLSLFREAGFEPKVLHRTLHANTIFRLVSNGHGLAIVPKSLLEDFSLPLKTISLSHYPQEAVLSVVWKDGGHLWLERLLGLKPLNNFE